MGTWWTYLIMSISMVAICTGETNTTQDGPLTPENFPYSQNLDPNYRLQWTFNATHIMFKTTVKTTGYIGFGLSDHGKMFPSDVIIAWVKDGDVHFSDRHAIGHFMPPVDSHQDWDLVSGSEDGEYTTITMVRQLDTCDHEDMAITSGTTRVIYSYSPIDPASDDDIQYHGTNRGTKSLLLLDPPTNDDAKNNLPDDVTTIEFLHHNYSLKNYHTDYGCTVFKLPPLDGKHHMIRYEPVIPKGNERLVHHMVLYFCLGDLDESLVGLQFGCYNTQPPKGMDKCQSVMVGWAVGGLSYDFPAHVGYALGGPGDPGYFRLETHYDNPQWKRGLYDSSGFRFFLTRQLRQHDAGMLEVGVNVDQFQIIPPHYDSFLSRGTCYEGCIEEGLGDDEIYVFADILHSHLLGTKMMTRHIRNGTELAPILQDDHYDFNYQELRTLEKERTIKKGDTLITDCYYDTSKKTHVTYGGLATSDEMCLSFLYYYPRKPLSMCRSRPFYNVSPWQSGIFNQVNSMDFTNQTQRDQFVDSIDPSKMTYVCLVGGKFSYDIGHLPAIVHPYVKEDTCKKY